jgi:hypothetical protein
VHRNPWCAGAARSGTRTPKKLATYKGPVTSLATDGKQVFVAIGKGYTVGAPPAEIDVLPADGSEPSQLLVTGCQQPDDLTYDERFGLLYTDWGPGNVDLVPIDALDASAPVEPVNVLSGVSPTSIALDEQSLYVASDPGSTNEKKGVIQRYGLSVIR